MDDPDCLQITPLDWEIITSSNAKKSIELKLKNDCKVDGTSIPLRNLQVKLKGTEDILSKICNVKKVVLKKPDVKQVAKPILSELGKKCGKDVGYGQKVLSFTCTPKGYLGSEGMCSENIDCEDNNPCTIDSCDADAGCVKKNDDGKPCDDDNPCSVGDACSGGQCIGGQAKICTSTDPSPFIASIKLSN